MAERFVFGNFEILGKLGQGITGEVFRVRQSGLERIIAVKRIFETISNHEQFSDKFKPEVARAANLVHRNITPIYEFGKVDHTYYISMEYVEGVSLRRVIDKIHRSRRAIPLELALFIADQVSRALAFSHTSRLEGLDTESNLHGDLHPGNVLIGYQGKIKITDLGIGRFSLRQLAGDDKELLKRLPYLSPLHLKLTAADSRGDIFSLGAMLYEMLTGQRIETIISGKENPSSIDVSSVVDSGLPAPILKVVLGSLSGAQYPGIDDYLADLNKCLQVHAPGVNQGKLSSFMTNLFSEEISREREQLEKKRLPQQKMKKLRGETGQTIYIRKTDAVSLPDGLEEESQHLAAQKKAKLVIARGNNEGKEFELKEREIFIGRTPEAGIWLDETTVSRRHACIIFRKGCYLVRDLGSLNGTCVNGQPITERFLEDDDELEVGEICLRFEQE